jgi:hypothetical protein
LVLDVRLLCDDFIAAQDITFELEHSCV